MGAIYCAEKAIGAAIIAGFIIWPIGAIIIAGFIMFIGFMICSMPNWACALPALSTSAARVI